MTRIYCNTYVISRHTNIQWAIVWYGDSDRYHCAAQHWPGWCSVCGLMWWVLLTMMTRGASVRDSKGFCKSINSYSWTAGNNYTFIYTIPIIDLWSERVVNKSSTQLNAILFDQFNIQACWWQLDFMDIKSLLFVWTIQVETCSHDCWHGCNSCLYCIVFIKFNSPTVHIDSDKWQWYVTIQKWCLNVF